MTFNVNPDTLFDASTRFLDLRGSADRMLGALTGDLSRSAGMAGADPLGNTFATGYDKAARQAVTALAKIDVHLGQIASGLLTTATNYWRADAGSNMQFPIDVNAPAQQLTCDRARTYREEDVASAQGAGVGVWDTIADTALSLVWPQGDTGKMRQAAESWGAVGALLGTLNTETGAAVNRVMSANSGDSINAFAEHCSHLVQETCYAKPMAGGAAIPNLQSVCYELSAYCRTAADQIEDARSKIKWLLIGAGVVTVVGGLLTVFTFGGSDVAAGEIDAGIIAEAESIIAAAEAEITASMSATMITEIEEFLAGLSTVSVGTSAVTLAGVVTIVGGTAIVLGAGGTAYAAPPPPGSPVPTPGGTSYAPLTPAERAAFDAWKNSLHNWPERGVGAEYDYQRRVAGPNVYRVPTGVPGVTIDADGLRSSDGAYVEAKHTGDPSCSPYNLDNADSFFQPLYKKILNDQDSEVQRYTMAIMNPANQGRFLEIDVNDPALVSYYVALMTKYHTRGRVVVIP
jgi:hypothetical protein